MKIIFKSLKFTVLPAAVILASCATKMPDNVLNQYAEYYAAVSLCRSYIDPTKMYQIEILLQNNLHEWVYDHKTLEDKIKYNYNNQNKDEVNNDICNNYIGSLHFMLITMNNERIQREKTINRNLNATANTFTQMGNSINSAGFNALNGVQSQSIQTVTQPQPNILYENTPNPMNNVSGQTLIGTDVSASGRKVCKYSAGATQVLPYGSVMCPAIYNN